MARAEPIARVSRCVPPAPGMTPIAISGWPNVASSAGHDHVAGHRQLAAAAEGEPAHRRDQRRADRGEPVPDLEAPPLGEAIADVWVASSLMSAPAANARVPAPVRTMARQAGSASSTSSASASASRRSKLRAR